MGGRARDELKVLTTIQLNFEDKILMRRGEYV